MLEVLSHDSVALVRTLEIAEKCNFEYVYHHYMFPKYVPVTGQTPDEFIRDLIDAGVKRR